MSEGSLDGLQLALGVTFDDGALLQQALVHSSYLNEHPGVFTEPNERLEFLGDAVLGVAVAEELYTRHRDWQEGELTQARAEVVRGETLAAAGARLDLGSRLLVGRGEAGSGGRARASNIAAAFEAVVGALFLDQGYAAAREAIARLLAAELDSVGMRPAPADPKSVLQEAVQRVGRGLPNYAIVETSGEDHARMFTAQVEVEGEVLGRGDGPRKVDAERQAALAALWVLGEA